MEQSIFHSIVLQYELYIRQSSEQEMLLAHNQNLDRFSPLFVLIAFEIILLNSRFRNNVRMEVTNGTTNPFHIQQ